MTEYNTETIVREEAPVDDTSTLFLVLIAAVLVLLIFVLGAYFVYKKYRRPNSLKKLPSDSQNSQAVHDGMAIEDNDLQKPQYAPQNDKKNLDDLIMPSKKRPNYVVPSPRASSGMASSFNNTEKDFNSSQKFLRPSPRGGERGETEFALKDTI